MKLHHKLPFGAEICPGGVRFRLWAPSTDQVDLAIEGGPVLPMHALGEGWFELSTDMAGPGSLYRYRIGDALYPDPAARFQPQGPLGPSMVIDPGAYRWSDAGWRGRPWSEMVLYELHPGTFSERGDFAGIAEHIDHLVDLGIGAIEVMPIAECPGRWNWGYDAVLPFAVEERYGGPDGLKRLVDLCHAAGISVILDVIYNHFGPEGNYLHAYAEKFFTEKHKTPWGAALNFDDDGARYVRCFFIENALYWLNEYHIDGLRFDAVHAIVDTGTPHFLDELGETIREAVTDRPIHLILENDANRPEFLGEGLGGPGPHTAQWNDDFHHALRVLIGTVQGGYYADYAQDPIGHLGRVLAEGFAYQGEASPYRGYTPRGAPSAALPPTAFVSFLQNHDQVGNHAYGWRLDHFASPEAIRAAIVILLLAPQIPMLFMGEEWNAPEPFPFFCDFGPGLADAVRTGRLEEFKSFDEFRDPDARAKIPDPLAEATFRSATLDWSARGRDGHRERLDLYRHLIALRRQFIAPHLEAVPTHAGTAKVLGPTALQVRWSLGADAILRMTANLGAGALAGVGGQGLGRRIFATHETGEDKALPPWFVAVDLADAGQGL